MLSKNVVDILEFPSYLIKKKTKQGFVTLQLCRDSVLRIRGSFDK